MTYKGVGFRKIRGTIFGAPRETITAFWSLYWGPPVYGNYHSWAWYQVVDRGFCTVLGSVYRSGGGMARTSRGVWGFAGCEKFLCIGLLKEIVFAMPIHEYEWVWATRCRWFL